MKDEKESEKPKVELIESGGKQSNPSEVCPPVEDCPPVEECHPDEECSPDVCNPEKQSNPIRGVTTPCSPAGRCQPDCCGPVCHPEHPCSPEWGCRPNEECNPDLCTPDICHPGDKAYKPSLLCEPSLEELPTKRLDEIAESVKSLKGEIEELKKRVEQK